MELEQEPRGFDFLHGHLPDLTQDLPNSYAAKIVNRNVDT